MKTKKVFALLLVLVLTASVFMTACGKKGSGKSEKPQTLEEYAVKNPDVQKSIDEATSQSDVEVEIKGNDVIYSFELSKMDGYTEDVAKDPAVVENLQKALDNAGGTFGGIAKTLEDATGLSGIRVVVYYTYEGETLATQTFDSSAAAAADKSSEEGSGDEEGESDGEETDAEASDDAS